MGTASVATQAPAGNAPSAAQLIAANNALFLRWAHDYYDIVQNGTIASGSTGGTTSPVSFAIDVPVAPAWCDEAIIQLSLPIAIVIPAGATANISPFAPWCLLQHVFTIGGAPPFAQTSGVPFWLDYITSRRKFDPADAGAGTTFASSFPQAYDQGGSAFAFSLGGLVAGGTIVNSGGAPATTNATVTATYRIRFQRRPQKLFGMVPMGDPQNRPLLSLWLSPLVGIHPEDNLVQDIGAHGITASLSSAGTVSVVWKSKKLDILPPGQQAPGRPVVGMGLTVNTNNGAPVVNAGQIVTQQQRTAMLYEKIFHVLVNAQVAQRPDYFGFWLTGEQQSARWQYDQSQGTLWAMWQQQQDVYGRFLPQGVMVADFESGDWPELPRETPYDAMVTPDAGYANQAGIAPTPAMYTALRLPSGAAPTGCYFKTYSLGLVNVTY